MRALKAVVIALGVLCLGAFGVLVWLVASKTGAHVDKSAPAAAAAMPVPRWADLDLGMPAGTRIVSIVPAGDLIAIHVRAADGSERVVIADPRSGTLIGNIATGKP